MNLDIFDEEYYLQQYPEINSAITQGLVTGGLDHFQRYGLKEGRTKVSRYYDEATYLENNPGVADAVAANIFASGLEHFINHGYEEGRHNTSPDYDETFYLNSEPNIASEVETGAYVSGFSHFLQVGRQQGLQSSSFADSQYLASNPEVAEAVNNGVFPTGQTHYRENGQFEGRSAIFSGTPGSDVILAYGEGEKELDGVGVRFRPSLSSLGGPDFNNDGEITGEEYSRWAELQIGWSSSTWKAYTSDGSNELDTLVGSVGRDNFSLGQVSVSNRGFLQNYETFYQGGGVALIQNFDANDGDTIKLVMGSESDWEIAEDDRGAAILVDGDLIAIVEGYDYLQLRPERVFDGLVKEVTLV